MLPMGTRLRNPRRSNVSSPIATPVSTWTQFTPAALQPALWLDASDASTITESSGSVSEWRDKSGNARHVSQATSTRQPVTGTRTKNGLNLIDFDGTNDILSSGSNSPEFSQMTIFVAEIHDTFGGGLQSRFCEVGNNLRRMIVADIAQVTRGFTFAASVGGTTVVQKFSSNDAATAGTFHILTSLWYGGNSATTSMNLRSDWKPSNGLDVNQTISVVSTLNAQIHIGARPSDDLRCFDGAIGELVMFNRALTMPQVYVMERYLNQKWVVY